MVGGEEDFRAEARAWLEANVPRDLPSGDTREGFAQHLEWERLLFENRWAVVSWPEEYGGRGASLWEWLIFEEEYYRAGGPQRVTQNGIFLLAPTVFEFGTPEQQERILPRMAAAEDLWCQGWSEPNAGSDLAGIQSRATKVDGGWLLERPEDVDDPRRVLHAPVRAVPLRSRQRAAQGPHVLPRPARHRRRDRARLRPARRRRGLRRGVLRGRVRRRRQRARRRRRGLVGGDGDDRSERGLTLRSPGRFLATTADSSQLHRSMHAPRDGAFRQRLVDAWMRAEAYQLFTLETVTRLSEGGTVGAESSINKIWWSELDVELHELALDLLGPEAQLEGPWTKGYQFALSGPIYAGTNEIQRNIAAERVLGLPRRMRFALTDDQVAFRDAVRDLLAKEPNDKRATWDALVDMGVTTVLVPEADGGLGLDEMTLVPVLEQTGYAALAFPVVETAMVAAPLGSGRRGSGRGLGRRPAGRVGRPCRASCSAATAARSRSTCSTPVEAVDPSRPVHRHRPTGGRAGRRRRSIAPRSGPRRNSSGSARRCST